MTATEGKEKDAIIRKKYRRWEKRIKNKNKK